MRARDAFTIELQDINTEDTGLAARTLASVAQAVLQLTASGFLPERPAMELIAAAAQMLGVEIEVEEALEEVRFGGLAAGTIEELRALIGKLSTEDTEDDEGTEE
jgi:broad specificity phosphatase PhoE